MRNFVTDCGSCHIGPVPVHKRGEGGSLDKRDVSRKDVNPRDYVLVLEEDDQIRELLERWLGEAGYQVLAPEAARDAPPVLVIANVPEPQAAAVLIRSLQEEYAAPILILSARFRRGLAGSAEAARRLGVEKVLPKPFTRKELLAAVRETVNA